MLYMRTHSHILMALSGKAVSQDDEPFSFASFTDLCISAESRSVRLAASFMILSCFVVV